MGIGVWRRGLVVLCGAILPALVPPGAELGETREATYPWGKGMEWFRETGLAAEPAGTAGNTGSRQGMYDDLIAQMSFEEGVDANLVHAIITMESRYDPLAVSPKGAKGLMQLRPRTFAQYAESDPFDPEANIRAGIRYLRFLQERFSGRLRWALAAYNAGETAVLRHKGVPPFRETRDYVARVLAHCNRRGVEMGRAALALGTVGRGRLDEGRGRPACVQTPPRISLGSATASSAR